MRTARFSVFTRRIAMPCTSLHLPPSTKDWTEKSRDETVTFHARRYWKPTNLPELVKVVVAASQKGQALHTIGSRWSFEDAAASDDWLISLEQLAPPDPNVADAGTALTDAWRLRQNDSNADTHLVHVEAGITIASLFERLDPQGWAMPVLGGSNGQSLAGAISTSTHGGDWQQPPFPDVVRAVHLVTEGGRELWIEPSSAPITTETGIKACLRCADATPVYDDRLFNAVLVACGRFGVIYSYVLEVRRSFRVVEVVNQPDRAAVVQALREGQTNATGFEPLLRFLSTQEIPAGLHDATGEPYFFQLLFASQDTNALWVSRRWETTDRTDLPIPGGDADNFHAILDELIAVAILALAEAAAVSGPIGAVYVLGYITYLGGLAITGHTDGEILAEVLNTLWKVPGAAHAIPSINRSVLDQRYTPRFGRGPHHLLTSRTRAESESREVLSESIELVFDASRPEYLDFLEDVLAKAPSFQQGGYISLRPSRRSNAYLSMHRVDGTHAVSIEVTTLKDLSGNSAWMRYVHDAAVSRGGRPHWGQYNKLSELNVAVLYGEGINEWREALLGVSGTSALFSNEFCRARGLEPTAIARAVTAVRKDGQGAITHLCHEGERWSPVPVEQAILEIQSRAIQYFTSGDDKIALVKVVNDGHGGVYLRSVADRTTTDNLDNLPPC
jgi:FAD/FMN-containing dehydrogenase